jgi:hypothetical protein
MTNYICEAQIYDIQTTMILCDEHAQEFEFTALETNQCYAISEIDNHLCELCDKELLNGKTSSKNIKNNRSK